MPTSPSHRMLCLHLPVTECYAYISQAQNVMPTSPNHRMLCLQLPVTECHAYISQSQNHDDIWRSPSTKLHNSVLQTKHV